MVIMLWLTGSIFCLQVYSRRTKRRESVRLPAAWRGRSLSPPMSYEERFRRTARYAAVAAPAAMDCGKDLRTERCSCWIKVRNAFPFRVWTKSSGPNCVLVDPAGCCLSVTENRVWKTNEQFTELSFPLNIRFTVNYCSEFLWFEASCLVFPDVSVRYRREKEGRKLFFMICLILIWHFRHSFIYTSFSQTLKSWRWILSGGKASNS